VRRLDDTSGEPDATVRRLLRTPGAVAAALVDVDSGLPLAVACGTRCRIDVEVVAAAHKDLVRTALDTIGALYRAGPPTEVVLSHGDRLHHVVALVADPFGDRLAACVLVAGPRWHVARARRFLRRAGAAPAPAGSGEEPAGGL
jgi:hypothetical protein